MVMVRVRVRVRVRVKVKVRVRCLEGSGRSNAWKEQLGAKNTIERNFNSTSGK